MPFPPANLQQNQNHGGLYLLEGGVGRLNLNNDGGRIPSSSLPSSSSSFASSSSSSSRSTSDYKDPHQNQIVGTVAQRLVEDYKFVRLLKQRKSCEESWRRKGFNLLLLAKSIIRKQNLVIVRIASLSSGSNTVGMYRVKKEIKALQDLTKTATIGDLDSLQRKNVRFPNMLDFDFKDPHGSFVVTELCAGMSLEEMHSNDGRRMERKAICGLAVRLLVLIEFIHKKGRTHGDIHPGNVVISGTLGTSNYVTTLVDFRNSRRLDGEEDKEDLKNLGRSGGNSYRSYCSANNKKIPFSRKHDLEMLAYMLFDLRETKLPYLKRHIRTGNTELKRSEMRKLRSSEIPPTPSETWKGLETPTQFLKYIKELQVDEQPNYSFWINAFEECSK